MWRWHGKAKDVGLALGAKLSQLEEQIYTLKRNELESLVAQSLLAQEAAKRGVSVAALMDAEVTSKVALVTEKEIDDYYRANKARMRGDEAAARAADPFAAAAAETDTRVGESFSLRCARRRRSLFASSPRP